MKTHIEKNTVQETLVIPLYGRKLCTEQFPNLFRDDKAVELINRLDYDFGALEKQSKSMAHRFGALEVAMRENDLMIEAKEYLKEHPSAALVNLGCGLDQTAENCDNGHCRIYNIDLPDVIAVRDELLPGTERIRNVAADLNDLSWFDKIDAEDGVCFLAAGVFYYFRTEQIKKLINAMALRFPGGKLVFDSANRRAVKIMLKTWVKEAGITSISDYFSVDSTEKDIKPWLKNATVSSRGYMLGYNDLKDPSVPSSFRLMARLGDGFMKMQIVRIDFKVS
jgi:O-methyltransferase involved in polyketide biosynthesis